MREKNSLETTYFKTWHKLKDMSDINSNRCKHLVATNKPKLRMQFFINLEREGDIMSMCSLVEKQTLKFAIFYQMSYFLEEGMELDNISI